MLVELWKPPPEKLNTSFILGEITFNINSMSELHPNIDTDMLRALVDATRKEDVENEDSLRALGQIFQDTYSFDFFLGQLESKIKGQVSGFLEGKSAAVVTAQDFDTGTQPTSKHTRNHRGLKFARHHQKPPLHECGVHRLVDKAKAKLNKSPIIYEDAQESAIMQVFTDVPFTKWSLDVGTQPSFTFVPTTVLGLQNLVKTFRDRRIRCSGCRHSSAPVFVDDGDVLVSMLPLHQVTSLPDPSVMNPEPGTHLTNELRTIQALPANKDTNKMHVRVGSAVTAGEFRQWAVKDGWELPADVVTDDITIGGLNGSICRGSGINHKTINDQVRSIEYVDANGALQIISNRDELLAAAGCFGLLGIVTHLTYEVYKATYAVMKPCRLPTMLAVPPVDRSKVPEALQLKITDDQFRDAVTDFELRAKTNDYAEWSWFPYQSEVFVNTWSAVPDRDGAVDRSDPRQTFLRWLAGWLGGVVSSTDFYADLPPRWQSQLLATTVASAILDPEDMNIKTAVPNAQHYRRDLQYMRVRGMELEIPIPALHSESQTITPEPDWSVARKIWWEMIALVYSSAASPMRLSLEMRVMADSDILLAPQRGNSHGTIALEIATILDVVNDED